MGWYGNKTLIEVKDTKGLGGNGYIYNVVSHSLPAYIAFKYEKCKYKNRPQKSKDVIYSVFDTHFTCPHSNQWSSLYFCESWSPQIGAYTDATKTRKDTIRPCTLRYFRNLQCLITK